MNWHALGKKEVLDSLKSDENGISHHESAIRLNRYGRNELKEEKNFRWFFILLQQFRSVFIIVLLVAALFSLFIGHYIDVVVIMIIVLINSIIGFVQQYKAEKVIASLKRILVPKVRVLRDGRLDEILSYELVPGDVILLSEGDKIMADCRVIFSNELETNEAILTGESFPQAKTSEVLDISISLVERKNMLYMGTSVVSGNGKAVVVSTGMKTEFGNIAGLVGTVKEEKTPIEKKLDIFSEKITAVMLASAAVIILLGVYRGTDFFQMFLAGIALAISAIPEGLPAVIALAFAFAIKRMEKHNALIRKLPAAETLGRVTVICSDKTGTMTEEKMTITQVYCNKQQISLTEKGFYFNEKKIQPEENFELKQLLKIGILCNNARIEKESGNVFGDPTEKALIFSAEMAELFKKEETEKEKREIEYAFSSTRKLMAIVRKNNELNSYVKGAPDVVLQRCDRELINGKVIRLTQQRRAELGFVYDSMADSALRVLAFAYKPLRTVSQDDAENDLIFVGFQGMLDPPRKEVKKSIEECQNAGIKVKMLTGDSLITANAVAKIISLRGFSVSGNDLEKLSEEDFSRVVRSHVIFARITPELKLRIVRKLKEQGEIVAVTGDGVNDVLALKEANIGIAMGVRGSDVTREVSDIVLLDDNFSSIVSAVREGRRVYDNIRKSTKFHLAANINELVIVFLALLMNLPLPLLPLAILWMNLITDSLPSLSLTVEKEDKDIMRRKPINSEESLLTGIFGFIVMAGFLFSVVSFLVFLIYYKTDLDKARTMALTVSVFCELFLVFTCRSDKENIWNLGWTTNKFLLYSVLASFILQVVAIYYAPLANVFGFSVLSFSEFFFAVGLALVPLIYFEAEKIVKRK